MRKILIFPAVHNETIGFELKFVHKALNGGIEIGQEGSIGWIEAGEGCRLPLRDNEHMKLVARRRMLKRYQVRGVPEAGGWDEKTHVGEDPTD